MRKKRLQNELTTFALLLLGTVKYSDYSEHRRDCGKGRTVWANSHIQQKEDTECKGGLKRTVKPTALKATTNNQQEGKNPQPRAQKERW